MTLSSALIMIFEAIALIVGIQLVIVYGIRLLSKHDLEKRKLDSSQPKKISAFRRFARRLFWQVWYIARLLAPLSGNWVSYEPKNNDEPAPLVGSVFMIVILCLFFIIFGLIVYLIIKSNS